MNKETLRKVLEINELLEFYQNKLQKLHSLEKNTIRCIFEEPRGICVVLKDKNLTCDLVDIAIKYYIKLKEEQEELLEQITT